MTISVKETRVDLACEVGVLQIDWSVDVMEASRRPTAEVDVDEELPSYLDVLNDIPPVPEGVNTSLLKPKGTKIA